ncbi:hypothetical protein PspLS_09440 [Pyricularia sp. CBS 133598]|nr:hypothetical protein PspLS_09440 [Pyricularia sp. CBS 133598]
MLVASKAGRLKAHVRLAQAVSDFSVLLSDAQQTTFKNLKSQSPPTADSVVRLSEEVNRDGARAHRSWRPYGTRLVTILERIRLFSRAGDTLFGAADHPIAKGVWASVKISLTISDLFMRLGRSTEYSQDLVALFPESKEIQEYMCEYLISILKICGKLVAFSKASSIRQVGKSFTLDSELKDLEEDLNHWAIKIDNKARVLTASSNLSVERLLETRFNIFSSAESKLIALEKMRLLIKRSICPQEARFKDAWRRQRKKGSIDWIFPLPECSSWESAEASTTLWITGILGSGKTVAMANIVGRLCPQTSQEPRSQTIIASFFCEYENRETLKMETIVRSITYQIVDSLDAKSLPEVLKQHNTWSPYDMLINLATLLPRGTSLTVILDALDECEASDSDGALQQLKDVAGILKLRLCCSSRSGNISRLKSVFDPMDGSSIVINLSADKMEDEIARFVDAEIDRNTAACDLPVKLREAIKAVLLAGAGGMFLWVSLQLKFLFPKQGVMTSTNQLLNVLECLPKDLEASFNRALSMIQRFNEGRKLFLLVAASNRPLTIHELRMAVAVEPGNKERQHDVLNIFQNPFAALTELSGGLVDMDEEDSTVRFIHHSVMAHLCRVQHGNSDSSSFFFSATDADGLMAQTCITYLSLDIHSRQLVQKGAVVDGVRTLDKIQSATTEAGGGVGRLLSALGKRRSPGSAPGINSQAGLDVMQVLRDELKQARRGDDDPGVFLDYSKRYWVRHSSELAASIGPCELLFSNLVYNTPPHVDKIWPPGFDDLSTRILWAMSYPHERIFDLLTGSTAVLDLPIVQHLTGALGPGPYDFPLKGPVLGKVLPEFVGAYMVEEASRQDKGIPSRHIGIIISLLLAGADPSWKFEHTEIANIYGFTQPFEFLVYLRQITQNQSQDEYPAATTCLELLQQSMQQLIDDDAVIDTTDLCKLIQNYWYEDAARILSASRQPRELKRVLLNGIDPYSGLTPLAILLDPHVRDGEEGQDVLLGQMLALGADVDSYFTPFQGEKSHKNRKGKSMPITVLARAIQQRTNIHCIRMTIEYSKNLNYVLLLRVGRKEINYWTPLGLAMEKFPQLIPDLIQHGADINFPRRQEKWTEGINYPPMVGQGMQRLLKPSEATPFQIRICPLQHAMIERPMLIPSLIIGNDYPPVTQETNNRLCEYLDNDLDRLLDQDLVQTICRAVGRDSDVYTFTMAVLRGESRIQHPLSRDLLHHIRNYNLRSLSATCNEMGPDAINKTYDSEEYRYAVQVAARYGREVVSALTTAGADMWPATVLPVMQPFVIALSSENLQTAAAIADLLKPDVARRFSPDQRMMILAAALDNYIHLLTATLDNCIPPSTFNALENVFRLLGE